MKTISERRATGLYWDRALKLVEGCTKVSPGCDNCWSETETAMRRGHPRDAISMRAAAVVDITSCGMAFNGEILLREDNIDLPLRVKKPTVWATWNDLYHPDVPDSFRDRAYAVMALCPQHTFLVLTKQAQRMAEYWADKSTAFRIALEIDKLAVASIAATTNEEVRQLESYPGYFVSNTGVVYSGHGSGTCLHCGSSLSGYAKKKYCSQKCRQNADYGKRTGKDQRHRQTLSPLKPLSCGKDGDRHLRVMLYRPDGTVQREMIHRLVLTTFDRLPVDNEQCCHRDGNAENNHIANLRWGTPHENWEDRKRHGRGQSWAMMTPNEVVELRDSELSVRDLAAKYGISDTQVRNIKSGKQWSVDIPIQLPPDNCWGGVTAEDQQRADERIPHLLRVPGKRFLSVEPMLSAIDLSAFFGGPYASICEAGYEPNYNMGIHAVLLGGESGRNARPMHPDWARSVRDQCEAAGVPFFFKQDSGVRPNKLPLLDGVRHSSLPWGVTP